MSDQPLKPFVIAMTFGNQPHQRTVVDALMAPDDVSAMALAVSKAHTTRAIGDMIDGICIAELTDEFITAAHRGTADPAPVLSIVATHGEQGPYRPQEQEPVPPSLVSEPPDGAA